MDSLLAAGFSPVCLDNYSTGHRFNHPDIRCIEVDLTDAAATRAAWTSISKPRGLFHFAAKALVGESMEHPEEYFRNNLLCTLHLAELAARDGVPFVHSSSCAVYGQPSTVPISESSPLSPISPYGETKRMSEQMLAQFCLSKGLKALNLRYFNPAGATENADHGERHDPETHLIPNLFRAIQTGNTVSIFGNTYPTPDGTCIRDFIHVSDLATGHLKAMSYLMRQTPGFIDAINLGSGKGSSVQEIVTAAEKIAQRSVKVRIEAARPGDPPKLIAAIEKAKKVLDWEPSLSLEALLRSHWQWTQKCAS